jgi:hypothetical protein
MRGLGSDCDAVEAIDGISEKADGDAEAGRGRKTFEWK